MPENDPEKPDPKQQEIKKPPSDDEHGKELGGAAAGFGAGLGCLAYGLMPWIWFGVVIALFFLILWWLTPGD